MDISDISIKQIRTRSLLSQADFAKELDVSFSTINRWENGKSNPSYKALKKLQSYCANHNIKFDPQIERNVHK